MDGCTRPPAGQGVGNEAQPPGSPPAAIYLPHKISRHKANASGNEVSLLFIDPSGCAPITSIWIYAPRICTGPRIAWEYWDLLFRCGSGEQNLNGFTIYSQFSTRYIATTLIDMLSPQPLLIHLTSSFLISTLRLTVEPDSSALGDPFRIQIPFVLVSPHSNISFSLWDNGTRLVADNLPVGDVKGGQKFRISARCQHAMAFRIRLEGTNMERMIPSPDFCTPFGMSQLLIGPDDREDEIFYGCIRNVSFGSTPLTDSWCRMKHRTDQSGGISTRSVPLEPHPDGTLQQLIYTGDKIQVPEGGSVPVNWKHLYLFPDRQRYGVRDEDVKFEIVDGPEHGALYRADSLPTASPAQVQSDGSAMKSLVSVTKFTYADITSQSLEYRHDGSETSEDSFDVKVILDAPSELRDKFRMSNVYTVSINVEPKDDPPQLFIGPRGPIINLAPGARVQLGDAHLRVWDADTPTPEVWIEVQRTQGVKITDRKDHVLRRFSLAQLLNGKIFLVTDGGSGEIELLAKDASSSSPPITLRVTSIPVDIHLGVNTGLQLPHRSSRLITSQNLSFYSNFPEIPIRYAVVDQPEFGVIECLRGEGLDARPENVRRKSKKVKAVEQSFQVCSDFEQSDIDGLRIRYRHMSDNRPQTDSFSFQAHCADTSSIVHVFHVTFIPTSIRVYTQESLLLNNTEQSEIRPRNLLATAFPQNFPRDQLLYHVVEPPKFGMLLRKIGNREAGGGPNKLRRIGVSSNFTQEHVDNESIIYKLHFVHYSVVNDFFLFRLITPAVVSELLRFDITYIPGGTSIQLLNRTLIVAEGATQQITNNTLWLETADDREFVFTLAVPPFNGRFVVVGDDGAKFYLDVGSTFTSSDILNKRLFYEHSGDESRSDRAHLLAESAYGKTGAKIPLWLSVAIIGTNDHSPVLMTPEMSALLENPLDFPATPHHSIYLIESGERVLHPSLLPWTDFDNNGGMPAAGLAFHFGELFRDFIICTREAPELSVRNFTQRHLETRSLIVRHLSLKKESKIRYTVGDGKHMVSASLTFVASAPFVQLLANRTFIPRHLNNEEQTSNEENLNGLFLLLTANEVSATSNIDTDLDDIRFEIHPGAGISPFRLLNSNGSLIRSASFLQRDVNRHRVFLDLSSFISNSPGPHTIPMRITATSTTTSDTISADVAITVETISESPVNVPNQKAIVLLRLKQDGLTVMQSSSASVDSQIVDVLERDGLLSFSDVRFVVVERPKYGSLNLLSPKGDNPATQSNNYVVGFRRRELASGRLQYIHSGNIQSRDESQRSMTDSNADSDYFTLNISVSWNPMEESPNQDYGSRLVKIGPIRIPIQLVDSNQILLVVANNVSMPPSSSALTLTARHLRVSAPAEMSLDLSTLEYRLVEKSDPTVGNLVNRRGAQPIVSAFTHTSLQDADILFVLTRGALTSRDEAEAREEAVLVLRACTSSARQARCSLPSRLRIKLEVDNRLGPELTRNEILSIPSNVQSAAITEKFLKAVDPDTPPSQLKYLVWQPIGGRLIYLNGTDPGNVLDHTQPHIHSFTQADLEDEVRKLVFVPDQNTSSLPSTAGFSFLVSDGVHQSRPEWFTIERVRVRRTAILEANTKLNAAPGISSVIAMDMLRANVANTHPDDILFRITRLPLHGRLLLTGVRRPVDEFTQSDINARRLSYQSQPELGAWSQRDYFNFMVIPKNLNGNNGNMVKGQKDLRHEEEYRFRIVTSYSNIPLNDLNKFVPSSPLKVYGAGGSVSLNSTHLNLTKLAAMCDDVLFVEVYRAPRFGQLIRVRDEFTSIPTATALTQKQISRDSGEESGEHFDAFITDSSESGEEDEDPEKQETSVVVYTADEIHSGRHLVYQHRCGFVIWALVRKWGPLFCPGPEKQDPEKQETSVVVYTADEIHSGRHLVYQHRNAQNGARNEIGDDDEFTLSIHSLREKHRRGTSQRLRVPITVSISETRIGRQANVTKFPHHISVVSGGRTLLNPDQFQITHSQFTPSQLSYRVIQLPSNGVRLITTASNSAQAPEVIHEFTQAQVNKGQIAVEHMPTPSSESAEGNPDFDLIGLEVAGQSRILLVRIEPLALRLVNHTEIALHQGKTYVVLNRSHLGAESNGDRSRVFYNVSRAPENGSFYWVAGEKQANSFTQKNVDDGEVLYAQLNMNAFQDSFDFILGNDEMELLQKTSRIVVTPEVQVQPLFTEAKTITQIGLVHLNASGLEGTAPRFLIISPPHYGRLFLHPQSNESAVFFTHSDIQDGRLFFHAFEPVIDQPITELIELELRSDTAQPARFQWVVDIRPTDHISAAVAPTLGPSKTGPGRTARPSTDHVGLAGLAPDIAAARNHSIQPLDIPSTRIPAQPDLDYRFPVAILIIVVLTVSGMLCCHRSGQSKSDRDNPKSKSSGDESSSPRHIPGVAGHRILPDLDDVIGPSSKISLVQSHSATGRKKALGQAAESLLDTTVYATVGRQSQQHKKQTNGMEREWKDEDSKTPIVTAASRRPMPLPATTSATTGSTFATFEVPSSPTTPVVVKQHMPPITIALPHRPVSGPIPGGPNSGVLSRLGQAQLAVAAAAAVASRQQSSTNNGTSGRSDQSEDEVREAQVEIRQPQVSPAQVTTIAGTHGTIASTSTLKNAIVNPARLKENQYWV
ncbi:cadherin-like domain-containing protein [Ditylenchus destructor]|nr:cadherin-like domain-containing protein [Ditylenchus destructor]